MRPLAIFFNNFFHFFTLLFPPSFLQRTDRRTRLLIEMRTHLKIRLHDSFIQPCGACMQSSSPIAPLVWPGPERGSKSAIISYNWKISVQDLKRKLYDIGIFWSGVFTGVYALPIFTSTKNMKMKSD